MKKYEEENIFLSKISFNTAMLVIVFVTGFFTVWIGQDKAEIRHQYASLGLGATSTQSFALANTGVSGPVTLDELLAASCALHSQLADDQDEGLCIAEGACQRSPEKLRKMCVFRIPKTQAYCEAGKYNYARMELINARNAMRDHVDLRAFYCHTNQIDCELVIDRLGSKWIIAEDFPAGTFAETKKRLLSTVNSLPPQTRLEPTAISIYAEIQRRVTTGKICD